MRFRLTFSILLVAALAAPSLASASFAHTVAAGESLTSVAAADGLSVSELAAANGLSLDSDLIAGSTLQIPPQGAGTAGAPSPVAASQTSAPATSGYVVQPGDTLSVIAERFGTSVQQLAAANGLAPAGVLLAGATLSTSGQPTSAAAPVVASSSPTAPASTGGAQPTAERVSPAQVGSIAAARNVPPSLAEAIAYQESGFNNNKVSNTGAIGVMQIEPDTWREIGSTLAGPPPLQPASAADNVRGGVLLIRSLLSSTGGDPALATAAYFQGLSSVQSQGELPSTQQYVQNVLALRAQFGGP
jgi:N-acetylmuramoyl-L-alanine amidase